MGDWENLCLRLQPLTITAPPELCLPSELGKCNALESFQNHPCTRSVENLSTATLALVPRKVRERCTGARPPFARPADQAGSHAAAKPKLPVGIATTQLVGHIDNGNHPVESNDWLRCILYSNQES